MKVIIIDIDDTLIDSVNRTKIIVESILECEISINDMLEKNLEQIFNKYADDIQRSKANELKQQFQDTLLCKNDTGIDLMKLNQPIPTAASVLQLWNEHFKLIYLTGRLERIRDLTLSELERFGFPVQNSNLYMIKNEDTLFKIPFPVIRKKQLTHITSTIDHETILRVVDDFPGYFLCYEELLIPERYGYCHGRKKPQDFFKNGATRVFKNWNELI